MTLFWFAVAWLGALLTGAFAGARHIARQGLRYSFSYEPQHLTVVVAGCAAATAPALLCHYNARRTGDPSLIVHARVVLAIDIAVCAWIFVTFAVWGAMH